MSVPTLSLTMIVKNEERNLFKCLESVKDFVDDIIVIDTGSTDQTKDIAQSFGARVFDFEWNNDFAAARNFSIQKSKSDWNLVLDADEYVEQWDNNVIQEFMRGPRCIGKIKIVSSFIQNKERKYSQEEVSRLIPNGCFYSGPIHEQIISDLRRISVPIVISHTGYENTNKSERNFQILFKEFQVNPNNPYLLYQIGRQYRATEDYENAFIYFKSMYKYIREDFGYYTDSVVSYLYTLIDVKKFELGLEIVKNEQRKLVRSPDFHFVSGVLYMNLVLSNIKQYISYLPLIEECYLRCLTLSTDEEIVIGTSTFLPAYNLGVYHETLGNKEKAIYWYEQSANYKYPPALKRLEIIK